MQTLTTVRYTPYTASDDIRVQLLKTRRDLHGDIIFEESIGPALRARGRLSVFYVRSFYDTDAARAITRRVHAENATEDSASSKLTPDESSYGLTWYAQQIYAASAVVVHFDDPARAESRS